MPVAYTSERAEAVLAGMAEGKSLRNVCRELSLDAPGVRKWVIDDVEGFGQRYAHARLLQVEAMADEIRDVAEGADASNYNAARLQVDTMKWLMSKVAPRQYGERTQLAHTDAEGGPLVIRCEGMPSLPVLGSQPPKALT